MFVLYLIQKFGRHIDVSSWNSKRIEFFGLDNVGVVLVVFVRQKRTHSFHNFFHPSPFGVLSESKARTDFFPMELVA